VRIPLCYDSHPPDSALTDPPDQAGMPFIADAANHRITGALAIAEPEPGPGPGEEEDDDSEQAS